MIFQKYKNDYTLKLHCSIFNPISDRNFWDNIRKSAVEYFENELKLFENTEHPVMRASIYRDFYVNGNRSRFENLYFSRKAELLCKTILECVYNDGRFADDILDLTWMILEETSWTVPAHVHSKGDGGLSNFDDKTLDLFLAETSCLMAFVYQVYGEKLDNVSTLVTQRIKKRLHHDITEAYLKYDDYFWMGLTGEIPNNWNPWIHSNVLASVMITEDDEDALRAVVEKVIKTLDIYIDHYPLDGACDEGPNYWNQAGLSMLECLWLLNIVTNGKIDCFSEEKVINTSEYFMKMYAGSGKCVNFADAGPNIIPYFAPLYKFSEILQNDKLKSFAKSSYDATKNLWKVSSFERIKKYGGYDGLTKTFRLFDVCKYLGKLESCEIKNSPAVLDYWLPSLSVMIAKTENEPEKGLFLAAKGGHNAESHNHNDIGQFIVQKNDIPFIIDSGNMTYTSITFSDKRYTLWTTRSAYHNVPFIDGFEQKDGRDYASSEVSYQTSDEKTVFSLNLKNAYENRDSINKWIRTFDFDRKNASIYITEDFDLQKMSEYSLNFLTLYKPVIEKNRVILTSSSGEYLSIEFDAELDITYENVDYNDPYVVANWGENLYRISAAGKAQNGKITYTIK